MHICICRGLSDKDFKENLKNYEGQTIRTDYCGLEEFHMECSGDGTQCGKCLDTIKDEIIGPHNKIAEKVHEMSDNQEKLPQEEVKVEQESEAV